MAEINFIDSEKQVIETSIGNLKWDILIIATGATSNYFGLKNIEKYAMPMKTLVESLNLRSLIIQNFEEALNTSDLLERENLMNFVIVGAGPTGIELAGALAELRDHILPSDYPDLDIRRMQINVIEASDRVLSSMSTEASKKTKKYLSNRNINVWLNTVVEDYDGTVVTSSKKEFKSKTLIWAAGIKADFPNGLQIEKSNGNRIITNEYNKICGHKNIYAIGDTSSIHSEKYPNGNPMLASVAEQQGRALALNLNKLIKNEKMKPFSYSDKGTMATFGRNKAVVDLPYIKFGGILGWFTWMFLHLMLLVDFRSKLVVFINWIWSYLKYDKGTRLIVRKYTRNS